MNLVSYPTQRPRPIPQHPAFQGWHIFDATPRQTQRFHEILDYITLPLNNCLRSRTRLGIRTRTKKVNAVRLAVAGPDRATARPFIVFFCGPDTNKVIRDFLEKPAYKQFFDTREEPELSFLYKIISDGVRLRCSPRAYAEIPDNHLDNKATNCGTPIRLYHGVSDTWGRSTLGGVLKATFPSRTVVYYAMTAGHFLDSSPDDDWGDAVDFDEDVDKESTGRSQGSPPWSFQPSRTYTNVITPCTEDDIAVGYFEYLDWALFPLDHWSPNALSRPSNAGLVLLSPPEASSKSHIREAGRQVLIIAPGGVIDGWLQPGITKMVIPPGQELIDTYIVTLSTACKCSAVLSLLFCNITPWLILASKA